MHDVSLSLVIWLPAVLAVGVAACGRAGLDRVARVAALAGASLHFAATLWLALRFDPTRTGFQLREVRDWVPELGLRYHVAVDGISLVLVVLVAFLVPIAIAAAWRAPLRSAAAHWAALLAIETGLLGALLSLNLVAFLGFSELAVLGLAFQVGFERREDSDEAVTHFLVASSAGALLLFFVWLVVATGHYEQTGVWSFDWIAPPGTDVPGLHAAGLPSAASGGASEGALFFALILGLALRAPAAPVHGWLRGVAATAPTSTAVLVVGGQLALGSYAFLRFGLPLFPAAALRFAGVLAGVAALAMAYAALVAWSQRDLKRRFAMLSLAQLMGVWVGALTLDVQGWNGSVVWLVSHGLSASAIFVLIGMLEERRGTRAIDAFGGIARPMPVFAFFFGVAVFASLGLPLLSGFVGEILVLLGAFLEFPGWALVAAIGSGLAAAVGFATLRRVLYGAIERDENRSLLDLDWREKLVLVALVAPIVWIGVHPSPLLRRVEPAVIDWVEAIRMAEPAGSEHARFDGGDAP